MALINNKRRTHIRNLTHNDFAIPVGSVRELLTTHGFVDNIEIKIIIRTSGHQRELFSEANRLKDLYLCSDSTISSAIGGYHTPVEEWLPNNLEVSTFNQFLSMTTPQNLTDGAVGSMIGYGNVVRILAKPQLVPTSEAGFLAVKVPDTLRESYTILTYDVNGLLTGHDVGANRVYHGVTAETALVEIYYGAGNGEYSDSVGDWEIDSKSYRTYKCPVINGTVMDSTLDVTSTIDYTTVDGKILWKHDPLTEAILVRGDSEFYLRDFNVQLSSGALKFEIQSKDSLNGNIYSPNRIPWAHVSVWLNGCSLVPGVDFHVDGADVYIYNTAHLSEDDLQSVTIMGRGLSRGYVTSPKVGWVTNGLVLRNGEIDILTAKNLRLNLAGKLTPEFEYGDTQLTAGILSNGLPYSLEEYDQPCYYAGVDPYSEMDSENLFSDKVEDYINTELVETEILGMNTIPKRWVLHSPALTQIVTDITNGVPVDMEYVEANYMDLILNDPSKLDTYDERYMHLYPWVGIKVLDSETYELLNTINRQYLLSKYNINKHSMAEML